MEFTARLVPEDPNGDEYSVASTLHGTAWTNEDDMRMEFYESVRERLDVVSGQLLSHARGRDDDGERRRACPARGVRRQHAVVRFRAETDSSASRGDKRDVGGRGRQRAGEDGVSTGFVTLDRTRRVVFLAESARGTDDEPSTGVWMQGIDRADGPATWAACCGSRAGSSEQAHAARKVLFVSLFAGASSPAFFEVTATHSSAPFVPFGVDMIVRPGETAEAQATPLDAASCRRFQSDSGGVRRRTLRLRVRGRVRLER